jgi:hypothetical protein
MKTIISMIQDRFSEEIDFTMSKGITFIVMPIMIDINEEWITGRRYINMEVYWGLCRIVLKLQQFVYSIIK